MPTPSLLPGRRLTAVFLVTAPLAELVESYLSPLKGTSTSADLGTIAAHQGRFVASVLIGMLLGMLLYVPAFLGLADACVAKTPKLARTGGWLLVATMIGFAGVRMVQAVELQTVKDDIPTATAAHLIDHTASNPIALPLLAIFLAGTLVGLVILAIATWRAGFSRVAAVLMGIFPVVDHVVDGHGPARLVSHVVMLVALSWFGKQLWTPVAVPAVVPADLAVAVH